MNFKKFRELVEEKWNWLADKFDAAHLFFRAWCDTGCWRSWKAFNYVEYIIDKDDSEAKDAKRFFEHSQECIRCLAFSNSLRKNYDNVQKTLKEKEAEDVDRK